MGKKLLDNKILYMALALALAVGLWFYVNIIQGELHTTTVSGIPVTFVGTDVLRENGLMIVGETPTVDLEVQANLTTLSQLTEKSITLRLDVSHITGATDYTLSYDIVPPAGVSESSFTVLSRSPANVSFQVMKYTTREVPIRGVLAEGSSIADDYVSRGFQFSQESVSVSGREDLVDQVKYARVTLGGKDLSETIQETRTYQLIGADNQVLEGLEVTCSPESVEVTYEIWKQMTVPLKVQWKSGGGATFEDNVSFFDISPESVVVQGRPDALESLKELTVATIDLADVDGTRIITREIPLSEGLEIAGGVSTATITVTVDGLEKQSFEIGSGVLSLLNEPEGFKADILTPSLTVTLRGTAEALAEVSPDNIRGSVDLNGIEEVSGQYLRPVRVIFDSVEGVGVLNGDYQVTVRLRR